MKIISVGTVTYMVSGMWKQPNSVVATPIHRTLQIFTEKPEEALLEATKYGFTRIDNLIRQVNQTEMMFL